jgi:hypothetical protein
MRFLLILFTCCTSNAATSWYFDNAATGAHDGTSWTNAWANNASIVWASINAGDTLYISGGTTTKTYAESITTTKDGASDSSRITIKIGQDAGHNGIADFGTNTIDLGGTPYALTLDGNRGLAYANPTNWYQVNQGDYTNNIGFWFHGRIGTTGVDTDPVFAYWTEGTHSVTVRYIRVSGYTNIYSGTCCGNSGPGAGLDERGIIFNGVVDPGDTMTNVVFEYLKLDHNSGSTFVFNGATNNAFDGVQCRFSLIDYYGEDVFQVNGGWSIHDNVIGVNDPSDVHADIFQITGSWVKIYNNLIREGGHAYMRIQSTARFDPANPVNNHDIFFFNNVHSELPGRGLYGGLWNEGWGFVHWDSAQANGGNLVWSNIWVVNNTHYGTESNTLQNVMRQNPTISWTTGPTITNAYLFGIHYLNNLWVMQHKGMTFPGTNGYGEFMPYTTNDFEVNFNVFAGTDNGFVTGPRLFGYRGVYTNAEIHPYQFRNTTNLPSFVNATSENFELSSTDTAARNTGTNLSAILGGVFNFDSLNRPRNVGAAWDRGALEAQETNLVIYLSFDGDTAGGNALDSSGNGFNGTRFTLSEYGYPSNKLYNASGAPGLTFRPNFTGRSSDHLWRTGSYGIYGYNGGTFGVTNANARTTNLAQMTVMCWARYDAATRVDPAFDSATSGNDTLISGGSVAQGTKGSWSLGRYNQRQWINNTRFVIQTNEGFSGGTSWGTVGDTFIGYGSGNQVIGEYPDYGFSNAGDTTNWYHYAATFSNGTVRTYFNGVFITNHTLATVTALTIGDGAARPYDYVGIGVDTHVGTPEFDDEPGNDYPNNGFHNGGLDQVRIYDRALSWQEIVNVANSEGAAFADAPSGGGGGGGSDIPTILGVIGLRGLRGFR